MSTYEAKYQFKGMELENKTWLKYFHDEIEETALNNCV